MKNIIFIFLSEFLSLTLISCSKKDDSSSSSSSTGSTQTFVDANHCRLTKNTSSRNSSLIVNERESDSINERKSDSRSSKRKGSDSMSTNLPFPNTRRTTISIQIIQIQIMRLIVKDILMVVRKELIYQIMHHFWGIRLPRSSASIMILSDKR